MCQEFIDLGYLPDDVQVISRGYYSKRNFDTPEISSGDLEDLVYRANLICNFTDNINMQLGNWERALQLFEPIASKYPFHVVALDCVRRCHEALGDSMEALATLQLIGNSLLHDHRARSMAMKYGDLLSEPVQELLAHNSCSH